MAEAFHLNCFLSILLLGLPLGSCDLRLEPSDLTIVVGQPGTFQLTSNSKIPQDLNVQFSVSYADVLITDPAEVHIPANSTDFIQEVRVHALSAGHAIINANASPAIDNVDAAFINVTAEHSSEIALFSIIVGWIYFIAWSVSFYPQIYENFRRKSVVGLNFDFLSLNLTGFILYSLFNCGLYWIPVIQDQYHTRHLRSAIPVQPNDIFFSVHAVFATLLTIIQCFIYERGGQTVSITARALQGVFFTFLFISMLCSAFGVLLWLDFLYYCSYVKLTITLIKYLPQAYMNYQRKSTVGWSIGNILLDFTGGTLSVLQMILDAYNYNDWTSIFGDPTKFGLGMLSVIFDVFFMVQHYILYRNQEPYQRLSGYEPVEGLDSPEDSNHIGKRTDDDQDEANSSSLWKEPAPSEFVT